MVFEATPIFSVFRSSTSILYMPSIVQDILTLREANVVAGSKDRFSLGGGSIGLDVFHVHTVRPLVLGISSFAWNLLSFQASPTCGLDVYPRALTMVGVSTVVSPEVPSAACAGVWIARVSRGSAIWTCEFCVAFVDGQI
jgi:hypothetical protein